jgi:hypothetical protein
VINTNTISSSTRLGETADRQDLIDRYKARLRTGRPGFIPDKGKIFLIFHSVQTGIKAYPISYPVGTGAFTPGVKMEGSEADHSPPSITEVKIGGTVSLLFHTSWRHA